MRYLIYIVFLLSCIQVFGQVTNTGELVIKEGTEVSIVSDLNNTSSAGIINDGELYLYKDFLNDGLFAFSSAMGFLSLQGNILQTLSGSEKLDLSTLWLNNSSEEGIVSNTPISIANQVAFSDGVLKNNSAFSFLKDGIPNTTSDESYIDGTVTKVGDTDFTFSIGANGFYRPASISSPDEESDSFSIDYIPENSNDKYTHSLTQGVISLIDTNEYWVVQRVNGDSEVLVSLTWNESTTSSEILSGTKTGIHIAKWNETKGFWEDMGGVLDEENKTVTTISGISEYGVFALARVKEDLILRGGCLTIYNAITGNDDGANDILKINCIEQYPKNSLEIYNRWGVKVFAIENYDNGDRSFKGISEGRGTVLKDRKLPEGTYYYVLMYEINGETERKVGYLHLNGN